MAFLNEDDDKQLQAQGQQAQGQGQAQPLQSGGESSVVTGGGPAGGGSQTAGPGGTQGWTNFQAYLKANQGDTSSSDALNKNVAGAFQQETSKIQKSAQDKQQEANSTVQNGTLGMDQASQLIQKAGSLYNNPGPQKVSIGGAPRLGGLVQQGQDPTYSQIISQLGQAAKGTYTGPKDPYVSQIDQQAQDYAQGLGDDSRFKSLMDSIYTKEAGGHLGIGALNLQQQLAQNDPSVQQARGALQTQYGDLQKTAAQTENETNAAIQKAQTDFTQRQSQLNDYLNGYSGQLKGTLQDAANEFNQTEQAIRDQYNQKYGYNPNLHSGYSGGESVYNDIPFEIDRNLFANYQPGGQADLTNIGGHDSERNQYDAIMDALGLTGNKINKSEQEAAHGKNSFDQAAFDQATEKDIYDLSHWNWDGSKYVYHK